MAQPPRIVTNFAIDLSRILSDYLTNPELEDKRIPLKDRVAIKIMLTLNKQNYRRKLLFRDYSQKPADLLSEYYLPDGSIKKLHTESIHYTQDVLSKRLTIVSKHKSLPTNLHLLLLMFFRYSEDQKWLRTRIKRKTNKPCINDLYFKKIANVLKRQCHQLKNMGMVSKTYREKYGIFHFISGNNSAELVEEISLFDVIEVVPTPLVKSLTESPAWYIPLLERILVSLNENYALLRSCGLSPHQWQGELSIGKLRALKQLKKKVDSYLMTGEEKDNYSAYQQAFITMANGKTKTAGFEDFTEFSQSDVGRALLKIDSISFDDENTNLTDTYPDNENNSAEMETALKQLLIDHANSFTTVTAYFFEQVLILQRPIYSEDGVFNDPEFSKAIKADDTYANLEGEKLADKLIRITQRIIKKHIDVEDAKVWLVD